MNYTKLKKGAVPYLLLVPSVLLIGIFKIYPILYSIVIAFLNQGAAVFYHLLVCKIM